MLARARNFITFQLERLLLRGAHVRLLVMGGIIGLVALIGGFLAASLGDFEGLDQAIWWAFLRLSDPGYLGDDVGLARRAVSTVLTVMGYALFTGSLVAIMAQWLNQTMRELESGHTTIAARDHILVIGWTSRTATILSEMLLSERGRVRRFLALHDTRRLRLVLMVEELSSSLRYELRDKLGPLWREGQIIMRSGSALSIEHLRRVDFLRAAAILLPSEDLGPKEAAWDARTIKTLLSMAKHSHATGSGERPLVVTEIFDARKVEIAKHAYDGPLEVVPSDLLIGRLQALVVLHPGLSLLFEEMLAYGEGNELHVVEANALAGKRFSELSRYFPRAVVVGIARAAGRDVRPLICPASNEVVRAGDRLVVIAREHDDALAEVEAGPEPPPLEHAEPERVGVSLVRRILVLGWSDKVPDLIAELADHHGGDLTVDVLSAMPQQTREQELADHALGAVTVRNLEGDVVRPQVLARHVVGNYDCIVLVSSDWIGTGAQSDARTIMTYLLVREAFADQRSRPRVLVELMDVNNRDLFDDEDVEVLVSPLVLGRVLAHVTLRSELGAVYEELFDAAGPVVALRSPAAYGLKKLEASFGQMEQVVRDRGDVLLGILRKRGSDRLALNPPKSSRFGSEGIDLVVVGTHER